MLSTEWRWEALDGPADAVAEDGIANRAVIDVVKSVGCD